MILPRIRASFDRNDALALVHVLGRHDPELLESARHRLEEEGIDVLLDDPRTPTALLSQSNVAVRPALVFYVLVRHALLEGGTDDRATADYLASMMLAFGFGNRAWRISEEDTEEFHYMVDLLERLRSAADGGDRFLVQAHTGNYALWLTGFFPDLIERRRRRGAPPYEYYEAMGSAGFRSAAGSVQAARLGIAGLLQGIGHSFGELRDALNRMSDRYLWRGGGDPVSRLLREVQWRGG